MRSGKALLEATKVFSTEDRLRSWLELLLTIALTFLTFSLLFIEQVPFYLKPILSVVCGLLYVRLFVIYHDYQHRAILQNSILAESIMVGVGIYLLAPANIWRRSHEHHHNNNSKLTLSGIGSYPTITKRYFLTLPRQKQKLYLINRHPLTIFFGYLTLFIYWLNLKSFVQSSRKHIDSLVALVFHFSMGYYIFYSFGIYLFFLGWFIPFFLAFAIGSYLFYSQHNFPGAVFCENDSWAYDQAAIKSTSKMVMGPVMNWFTGNIGYHHVHHLNSRIPFYRLQEAMNNFPELDQVKTTSWHPRDILNCLRLKLWDSDQGKMISLKEL